MSDHVLLLDPQGAVPGVFRPVMPGVAALQTSLKPGTRTDDLLPGISLLCVGSGVAMPDGLVADLLFVDGAGVLTVLTGLFLSRSDARYDSLFAADLLQAAAEIVSWSDAALAQGLPAAAQAGAKSGRVRLIVPVARSAEALAKLSRLLSDAVSLHVVHWRAWADAAGRTLLLQEPPAAAPAAPGASEAPAGAPAAPLEMAPPAADREASPAPAAGESSGEARPAMPPSAPRSEPAAEPPAAAPPHQGPLLVSELRAVASTRSAGVRAEAEALEADATTQTLREAAFLNLTRESVPELESPYRRLLAWARGNGRIAFTQAPSLLYHPWPDLPATVLHATADGRMEVRLEAVLPYLPADTVSDVCRRLRLLAGREVDPQAPLALAPPQSLDEDLFSVLLSTLRLVAYSRPNGGLRHHAD